MTDESLSSSDLNLATGEDHALVTSKDDHMTTTTSTVADENGYESECSSSTRSNEDVACSALEVEADAFTRFIERQRVEVMFELRRLRLGERPVTGQDNRERIETFLTNLQDHHQETRVPSTRPSIPSAHMADIDALSSRRCVSAALSSAAFRRDLENTVRHSIATRTVAPVRPTLRVPPVVSQVPTPIPVQQQSPQVTQTIPLVLPQQRQSQLLRVPLNIERQEQELNSWQAITQLQRERIVVEISDLVHRQLVTSALESDFSQHLERSVLNRLGRGPLPPAQQFAPAVVQPHVPQPVRANAPASETNIDGLSSRLDSMQQMLQLMFTMQMDMQRSLRQEVASAFANQSMTTMTSATQPMHAGHCTICLTAIADTVLYRCGHLCICYTCGLQLQQAPPVNGVKCPICRAPVDDILRVYRSSRDGE